MFRILSSVALLAVCSPAFAQSSEEPGATTEAPPAAGPTQTVDGAQQFLKLITQQFKFVSAELTDANTYARWTNIKFDPGAPCRTRTTSSFEWSVGLTAGGAERSAPELDEASAFESWLTATPRLYGWDANMVASNRRAQEAARFPREINWSSVSSVTATKATQYETTNRAVYIASQPGFYIVAPDAPTAARVAYAMEFLRAACDQSAETGF